MFELGIIGKVDEITDEKLRFYAFIGLSVSTAAAIEHRLFDCYHAAVGDDKTSNSREFYKNIKFRRKCKITDNEVRKQLLDQSAIKTWGEIISEIQSVMGPAGGRNLVSHNPLITSFMFVRSPDGMFHFENDSVVVTETAVRQNRNIVQAGLRKSAKHTLKTYRNYAAELCHAQSRLDHFYETRLEVLQDRP